MKKIAHLETYGFNEQSQFNGVSNGATNEKTEKELKSINETNKAQDEQISSLKVDIKKEGNLFTISQGENELAKIHQEEGNGSTIVSGNFEGTNLVLTKDNNEKVTVDASTLALKTELPTVPTKISAFENDANYLTEHQSLDNYALKRDIPSIPTNISSFENDAHYLTEHQDISNLASKSSLNNIRGLAEQNRDQILSMVPNVSSASRDSASAISMARSMSQTIDEKLMPEDSIVDSSIKPVQSKAVYTKFKEVDKKVGDLNNAVTANTNNINSIQQSLTHFQSDPTLNDLSTNPIQNQAVATKFIAVEKTVKDLQKDKLDKNNATFTGTILNGVTDIVKAIQLLANKLDAQP